MLARGRQAAAPALRRRAARRRPHSARPRPARYSPAARRAFRISASASDAADLAPDDRDLLDIRITVVGDSALISLTGELDLGTAPHLLEAVDTCLADRAREVSIDLSAVTFCDCAGLSAIDLAGSRATARGGKLQLLSPSPQVVRLFSLLRGSGGPHQPPAGGLPSPR